MDVPPLKLVFPGEGPRASLAPVFGGKLGLRTPTVPGFTYQLEQSGPWGDWKALGDSVAGSGNDLAMELDPGASSHSLFRVTATPSSP